MVFKDADEIVGSILILQFNADENDFKNQLNTVHKTIFL